MDRYNEAKEFIAGIPMIEENTCKAYSFLVRTDNSPMRLIADVCHMGMNSSYSYKLIASGFQETKENKEWFNPLKDFLISDKSPWRSLIYDKNGLEYVTKDGMVKGWILPEKTVLSSPFQLAKNFAIFSRTVTEHADNFYFWWLLVQSGMSMNDALYFCHAFTYTKGIITKPSTNYDLIQGWHWAFTDQNDFNWEALRTGVLNTIPVDRTNYHFRLQKSKPGYKTYTTKLAAELKKSTFSSYEAFDFDEVLEDMHSWATKNNVKG